ncbi:MAG: class I SAM-dependent methyltransferase [Gemmatimonadaceae bacterium]
MLKQAKWRALRGSTGSLDNVDALDLGADNGVISWLFRRAGGRWASADLTTETTEAIRAMVGDEVYRVGDDASLPFADERFDLIVVVDLLEHLEDDRRLLAEIGRCARIAGRVVLNVPHAKPGALLRHVRNVLGLTDVWHGHRHAGYTAQTLSALLPPTLRLRESYTYSRFFSHALDTALNWVNLRGSRGRAHSTAKGMVVTGGARSGGRALRAAFPVMRAFAALDALIPWTSGYMLLATLERVPGGSTRS